MAKTVNTMRSALRSRWSDTVRGYLAWRNLEDHASRYLRRYGARR